MEQGIELLPKTAPAKREKIITLGGTAGTYAIIVIQIILLLLIGLRFKLRHDLATLASSIAEKEEILLQNKDAEERFRAIQNKIEAIAAQSEGLCYLCVIQTLEGVKPPQVTITNLSLEADSSAPKAGKLSLTAETPDGPSFVLLVANLLKEETVKEVALTSGSLSEEGVFSFSMELLVKPSAERQK